MRIRITISILFLFGFLICNSQDLLELMPDNLPNEAEFGYAVAMDGDYAVIGAPTIDGGSQTDGDPGRVFIYESVNGSWIERQVLYPQQGAGSNTHFGSALDIKNGVIVVGAYGDENNPLNPDQNIINHGIVYVYELDNTSAWILTDMITAERNIGVLEDFRQANADFGKAVATDGVTMVVGESRRNSGRGRIYVYERNTNGEWDVTTGYNGGTGEELGDAVAVSGDYIVAGAPEANNGKGKVVMLRRTSSTTSGWEPGDIFNGTPNEIFITNGFVYSKFGHDVAIDDNRMIITEDGYLSQNFRTGIRYTARPVVNTYLLNSGSWEFDRAIIRNFSIGDNIPDGRPVADLRDSIVIVGYPPTSSTSFMSGFSPGRVYLYELEDTGTRTLDFFNGDSNLASERFGSSVALNDVCRFMAGTPRAGSNNEGSISYSNEFNGNNIIVREPDLNETLITIQGVDFGCCNKDSLMVTVVEQGIVDTDSIKQTILSQPEKFYRILQNTLEGFYTDDAVQVTENSFFEVEIEGIRTTFLPELVNPADEDNYGVILELEVQDDQGKNWVVLIPFLIIGENPIFVRGTTALPRMPTMILHDPPGDGSSSKLIKGKKFCRGNEVSLATGISGEVFGTIRRGAKFSLSTEVGFIVGLSVGTEVEVYNEISASLEIGYRRTLAGGVEVCYESNEEYLTSGNKDVFIGYGSDLVYGVFERVALKNGCDIEVTRELVVAPVEETIEDFVLTKNQVLAEINTIASDIEANYTGNLSLEQDSIRDILQNQIDTWNEVLAFNENNKANSLPGDGIIKMDIGENFLETGNLRKIVTTTNTSLQTNLFLDSRVAVEVGAFVGGSGASAGAAINFNTDFGRTASFLEEEFMENQYTLFDDDEGDSWELDIRIDPAFGTFVFNINESDPNYKSSCPYEGGYQRDQPNLSIDDNGSPTDNIVVIVNDDRNSVSIPLNICNDSNEARDYNINQEGGTNLKNALLRIDGKEIRETSDEPDYPNTLPNSCFNSSGILPTLLFEKNQAEDIYENVRIFMQPSCLEDSETRSTVNISVYFNDSYNDCFPDASNNIDLVIPSTTTFGATQNVRRAANTLTAANTLNSGTNTIYSAGQSITLQAGFHAQNGSQFQAQIEDCNLNSESEDPDTLLAGRNDDTEESLSVYPNPFSRQAKIRFYLSEAWSEVEIAIRDMNGKVVYQMPYQTYYEGWNEWVVQADGLATGMYFLSLQTNKNILTEKIMITH